MAYARLSAPYDGVVTQRNINASSRRSFVQPPTAGKGDPLYVIERRDLMRIFVEVPEADSVWVSKGAEARIRVGGDSSNDELAGTVKRTSYSVDRTTRTLLAEIDLPNPDDQLRPGMYAYATITIQHKNVLTIPASAVLTEGDVNVGYQSFCFLFESGRVRRTPIKVGFRNDQLVEVLKKQASATPGAEPRWESFGGKELVVQGELSGLKDGQEVNVSQKP